MDPEVLVFLNIGLGIILGAIFLVLPKLNKNIVGLKYFLTVLFVPIFFLFLQIIFGAKKIDTETTGLPLFLFISLPACFLWFSIFIAWIYRKEILPKISALTVLINNLILVYILITNPFNWSESYLKAILILISIPTLLVMVTNFIKIKLSDKWKYFIYAYFIIITLGLLITFSFYNLRWFLNPNLNDFNYVRSIIFGINLIYFLSYICYLFPSFFPDYLHRFSENKKYSHFTFIVNQYFDNSLKPLMTFFILLIFVGIFIVNYYFKIINSLILANLLILFFLPLLNKLFRLSKS